MGTLRERDDWTECLDEARRMSPRIDDAVWTEVGEHADRVGSVPLQPEYLRGLARFVIGRQLRAIEELRAQPQVIEELARELQQRGFVVRRGTNYFADNGISVDVAGRSRVHLYVVEEGLCARIASGGQDWVRSCASLEEARIAALTALDDSANPPGPEWNLVSS